MSFSTSPFGTSPFGVPAATASAGIDASLSPASLAITGSGIASTLETSLTASTLSITGADVSVALSTSGTVTLMEVGTLRVIQRRVNTEDAVVTLSGTYTGVPTAIQARVVADVGGAEVVAWTTIDAAPSGGVFSGTITVPQGGWYQAEVRFSNATAVTDATNGKWGVGITCLCIGQSNIAHWFDVGTSTSPALAAKHTGAQYPSTSGSWSEIGTVAQGATAFADELITTYGIPVGLFAYAVGGTRIFDWASLTDDLYRDPRKAVQDEGGAVEYVLWVQGERDAVLGTSQSSYETSFGNLVTNLRNDIDPATGISELPILVSLLGRGAVANLVSDANGAAVRAAQRNAIAAHTSVYLAATTTDLDLSDGVHYTAAEYERHAARMAQTIRFLRGDATYYRGPYISNAISVDTTTIDVVLSHRAGTDFTPTTGIAGFEILDNGTPVTPSSAVRQNATTVRLTAPSSLTGPVSVRYMYGIDGGVTYANAFTGELVDNTALALPLESFDSLPVSLNITDTALSITGLTITTSLAASLTPASLSITGLDLSLETNALIAIPLEPATLTITPASVASLYTCSLDAGSLTITGGSVSTSFLGSLTLTGADIEAIANAVWAHPQALTLGKFLALKDL